MAADIHVQKAGADHAALGLGAGPVSAQYIIAKKLKAYFIFIQNVCIFLKKEAISFFLNSKIWLILVNNNECFWPSSVY